MGALTLDYKLKGVLQHCAADREEAVDVYSWPDIGA